MARFFGSREEAFCATCAWLEFSGGLLWDGSQIISKPEPGMVVSLMVEKQGTGEQPCPEGQIRREGRCVMPEVTFAAFIISLNTSALYHLGEICAPGSEEKIKDLVLAKHAIDTLKLIHEKTSGNLTEEEDDLLKTVLYDLKMRYVKVND
jgi:hypothetical protein